MIGLFDGFEGYRIPTRDDKSQALVGALVAIDANVLLNLYRYHSRTTQDLLDIFEKLADRLVVPHQAMREFHRNRINAIGNPEQATRDAVTQLDKSQNGALHALAAWGKQIALEESESERLQRDIEQVFTRLRAAVKRAAPDRVHPATASAQDRVMTRLTAILDGKVLARPEESTWNELIAEGKRRVDALMPPGYEDADKGDQNPEGAAGDYLVYAQACHEAGRRQMNLVIVTNDVKEDWWWRREGDLIGPRQEMTKEFFDQTGCQLFLMRPSDLLELAEALNVKVNPSSAEDAALDETVADADADTAGKYGPLTDYLVNLEEDHVTMTFPEIEDILGGQLAPSARKYPAYWYSRHNSLAKAIGAAGFRARSVHLAEESLDLVQDRAR